MPAAQHKAISKLARKTNHIERCTTPLRQRVVRLACDAWSFAKKLAHHIGAMPRFLCHYNLTRAAAESEHDRECTTAGGCWATAPSPSPSLRVTPDRVA